MEIIKTINGSCDHHNHSVDAHEHSGKDNSLPDGITSRLHDGALVCSANRHISGDLETVRKSLEKELGMLDKWVEKQDGITGHIKAIISVNGPAYRISATGGEVESKTIPLKNIHVSIASIVFKIDQKTLDQRIESLFEGLIRE